MYLPMQRLKHVMQLLMSFLEQPVGLVLAPTSTDGVTNVISILTAAVQA
jgi:hypothetical protein